jgi:hypothetical protein
MQAFKPYLIIIGLLALSGSLCYWILHTHTDPYTLPFPLAVTLLVFGFLTVVLTIVGVCNPLRALWQLICKIVKPGR